MIEHINIQGYKIICSTTDMNIINSYQINDITQMKNILIEVLNTTKIYKTQRSMDSLLNEWISHNIFYKLNIYRKHTRDCNFESKQKISIKIIYFVFSRVSKIKYYIIGAFNGRK